MKGISRIITAIFTGLFLTINAQTPQVKEEYHSNGKLKLRETFDGQWERYFENGKLEGKYLFIDDDWIEKVSYFPSGQLEYKKYEHRKSRRFRGNETVFYENGKVAERILCDSSHQVESIVHYFENGQLKDSSDSKTGYSCSFYSDGKLQSRNTYKCKSPGGPCKFDGAYVTYYENGQLKDSLVFVDGCPIGAHITYYSDGKLKEYQTYLSADNYNCADFMRGFDLSFEYRHSNKPPRSGEYHYNWPNSMTREEGEFLNGRKVGFWYLSNSDAEPTNYTMENYDRESRKDGAQEWWFVDGNGKLYKAKIEVYEHGQLKEEIEYDSENKIIKKLTY